MLRSHELHSLVLAEAAGTGGVLCPIAAISVKGGLSESSGISSHPGYCCFIGVISREAQGKKHNNGIYSHLRQKRGNHASLFRIQLVFNSCIYLEFYLTFFPLVCMHGKTLQLCLILSDTMDCRLPCSSVHGTSQARILE